MFFINNSQDSFEFWPNSETALNVIIFCINELYVFLRLLSVILPLNNWIIHMIGFHAKTNTKMEKVKNITGRNRNTLNKKNIYIKILDARNKFQIKVRNFTWINRRFYKIHKISNITFFISPDKILRRWQSTFIKGAS